MKMTNTTNAKNGKDNEPMRLDLVLSSGKFGDLSRSYAAKLVKDGAVFVNGKVAKKPSELVDVQDHIVVHKPEPKSLDMPAQNIPVEVVYNDEQLLVVNKPRGMVVHPSKSHADGTLVNALLYMDIQLSTIGGVVRPGIVHRLDKDTSGLMLVAKTDRAHQSLSQQFKNKTSRREYIALVEGHTEDQGFIDAPIARHPKSRVKMAVVDKGRAARTHYITLCHYEDCSLVLCRLETGRTHQIRVHMAHIGHPIIADPVYGISKIKDSRLFSQYHKKIHAHTWNLSSSTSDQGEESFDYAKAVKAFKEGQVLHAIALSFIHPITNKKMEIHSRIPGYFKQMIYLAGGNPGEAEKMYQSTSR